MTELRAGAGAPMTRRRALAGLAGAGLAVAGGRRAAVGASPRALRQDDRAAGSGVKAVYLNPVTDDGRDLDRLLALIDQTELNALVLDVKEEAVYYETEVALYRESGLVAPYYDPVAVLATLRERGVYAIARLVVFKDTPLAQTRPDLAVVDTTTGGPWYDDGGVAWLNPLQEEVWAANLALAAELAELGFDEVQFDYVRFPSDGDLSTTDYGRELTDDDKIDTIAQFLGRGREVLAPLGVQTSADVFGFTLLQDDIGIGQNAARVGEAVDYVCPMVYPSHFPNGSIDVPGHPNDFPAETIAFSLEVGVERVPVARLRPWLQDFSLPGLGEYGAAAVRAQIDATEAAGAGGWMLWNAANIYQADALAAG